MAVSTHRLHNPRDKLSQGQEGLWSRGNMGMIHNHQFCFFHWWTDGFKAVSKGWIQLSSTLVAFLGGKVQLQL